MTELYKELTVNTEWMTELYKESVKITERMAKYCYKSLVIRHLQKSKKEKDNPIN
ncbi:MAG: hypothetical protein M3Z01_05230 [Thermoproteota archaeon]|nr:hypothetical protein [Thermoproteota archaeon]